MDLPQPPAEQELKNIIDKLAQFVARNGPEFEHMTKQKQRDNPKFSFLFGGEFFNYYQYRVTTEQAILKQKQKTIEQQQAIVQHAINQQSIQSAPWQQPQPQPQPQIQDIQEQIRQSEQNLAAQHQLLLQQQQVQVDDAIRKAQDEKITNMAKECDLDLNEFASVLQPIIDCCTKDTISNGKSWIFSNATSGTRSEVIAQYILKRVTAPGSSFETKLHLVYLISDILHHCQRKNADELKKTLDKIVVPLFCSTSIGVDGEKQQKLLKVYKLWETNKYFSQAILDHLQNPSASLAAYQASLIAEHANLIIPITSAIQNQYSLLQKQHQDFVNHLTNQVSNLQPSQAPMIPGHQQNAPYPMMQPQSLPMMPAPLQQTVPPIQTQSQPALQVQTQMEVASSQSQVLPQTQIEQQQPTSQPNANEQNTSFDSAAASNSDDNNLTVPSIQVPIVAQQESSVSGGSISGFHATETNIPGPMFTGQPGNSNHFQGPVPNGPPFPQYGNGYPPRFSHPPPPRFLLNAPDFSHTPPPPPHLPSYNQGPPHFSQPPPDINVGAKHSDVSFGQIYDMMELVKTVDNWTANFHEMQAQPPPPEFRDQLIPPNMPPYYDLPAGLMVPLVKLEDSDYKPLEPNDIKLPPPALPTERLLAAVERFYSLPSREPSRDGSYVISSDGWEQLGLYEYYKAKAQSKKRKQGLIDANESGESSQEADFKGDMDIHGFGVKKSPPRRRYRETISPEKPTSATIPPVMKSRRSRSRSKSRSRSRSRSKSRSKPKSRSVSRSPSPHRPPRFNRSRSRSRSRSKSLSPSSKRHSPERSPTPPSFFGSSYGNASHEGRLDESNKGHQLLKKMGWSGAGLGATEQGIQDPVKASDVRDRQDMYKGIGINLNDPYENFRKSKRQAFINRMKARAGELGKM